MVAFEGVSHYGLEVFVFSFHEGNDLGFGFCIEEVVQVQDGGVNSSRVESEGCDRGVGVGLCRYGGCG